MIFQRVLLSVGFYAALASATIAMAQDAGVLVFGGTGNLGSEIVKTLIARGQTVTVFTRPTSDRKLLDGLTVDFVVGDLLKPDEVTAAVKAKPYRVLIDTTENRDDPAFYSKVQTTVAQAAKAAGHVRQIIIHGSIGAGDSWRIFAERKMFPTLRLDRLEPLMADKTEGERAVIDSGVPYTIIRHGSIGAIGATATGHASLTEDQMRWGYTTRADMAKLTLDCLDAPECANKIFHIVDPSLDRPYVPTRPDSQIQQ